MIITKQLLDMQKFNMLFNRILNLYKYFYFIFIFNRLHKPQFKLKLLIFSKKSTMFFSKRDYKKIILNKTTYNIKKHNFFKKKTSLYVKENIYNVSNRFLKVIFSNRKIIKNFFFKKFTKQKKITRFLQSISLKKDNFSLTLNNFLVTNLLRSHIFFFINDVNFFLKKSFVMVNGSVTNNKFFELKKGDCVQVVRSNYYYNYIKKIYKFFKKKISKMKFKRWRSLQRRKKTGFFLKTWVPNFLDKFIFFKTSIPKFLEVDFFSLSFIMLYNNKNILLNDKFYNKIISYYMIKMYNWRIK